MKLSSINRLLMFICLFLICFLKANASIEEDRSMEENNDEIEELVFVDGHIQDVIEIIARTQGYNFIIGDEVTGLVTLNLQNVSAESALRAVVLAKGYRYILKDNLLRVDTEENIAMEEEAIKNLDSSNEQLITVVFELKYVNGQDLIDILKTQLSNRGQIIPLQTTISGRYKSATVGDEGGKLEQSERMQTAAQESVDRIMVKDTVSALSAVKKLLDELDVMPGQILIESKIVENQLDSQVDIGVRWDFLGAGEDGTGGLRIGGSKISREFIDNLQREKISTDTDLVNRGKSSSNRFTDTTIINDDMSIESDEETQSLLVGVETLDSYSKERELTDNIDLSDTKIFQVDNIITDTIGNIATATLNASDFNIVLNALKNKGDLEVVSIPSIMTLNNHEASILVGERYPILQSSTSDQGTVVQTFDRYEPVGIQLQVLPRILHDNFVRMIIKPSVTNIGPSVGSPELQINRINTREASTSLIVKSGNTVVIGGLLDETDDVTNSGIPLLSKIPVLGRLFKYKQDRNSKINLTVFVTPTIVREEEHKAREVDIEKLKSELNIS